MAGGSGMVCVASVATAHGVRGALKLRCYTEEPESVAAYGPVFDAQGRELFRLTVIGSAKGGVIARADGIDDRDAAEALRGLDLYVPRDRLPATEEDEFYVSDLVGMDAVDPNGDAQGRIIAVHNFGAGDLIEVQPAEGQSQLVPFTREAVPDVDLVARRAVIVLPQAG
jgi:16S rRNA processing protein RimM